MTPRPSVWRGLTTVLLATISATLAAQTTTPEPEIYICTDAKGRKLTSDRKIPECHDREQRILNPSGTTKTVLKPALTAQEHAELDAKDKAAQQVRARLEEEKKRDRALLIRYPNPARHHQERGDALNQVHLAKQAALKRIAELQNERAKLRDEMAFYTKDPGKAPLRLRQQIDSVTQGLTEQDRFVTEKDMEIARIHARFDEALLRLHALWRLNETPSAE